MVDIELHVTAPEMSISGTSLRATQNVTIVLVEWHLMEDLHSSMTVQSFPLHSGLT